MITSAQTDRMVIISDLHLGNPFSRGREKIVAFLQWAARQHYDVCINGDGLDIAQSTFSKLAQEVPEMVRAIRDFQRQGRSIYYVVGNHDIALENFLEDWGSLKVCPFLNLTSAKTRIRIEHGHLYDPFFISHPVLYEVLTRIAGWLLQIHPEAYRLWIFLEKMRARFRARKSGIIGEPPEFAQAAHELSRRGFDVVILGHTHHRGEFLLKNHKRYLNSGSWLLDCDFIEIHAGQVELKKWTHCPD